MKKTNIEKIVIIIAGIIALIGLFLPYQKSVGEYRESLKNKPDTINIKEVNFTNKDLIDISIVKNFKVYSYSMNNNIGINWAKDVAVINVIITVVLMASIIFILLFAILNKRILTIVFDVLLAISSLAMNFDIVDRGIIPSSRYTYGISYYLYLILAVIILVSVIVSIIRNRKIVS